MLILFSFFLSFHSHSCKSEEDDERERVRNRVQRESEQIVQGWYSFFPFIQLLCYDDLNVFIRSPYNYRRTRQRIPR